MPRPERGQTPAGFREQLLQRIRNEAARQGVDPRSLQQRVAFERLLARLAGSGDWVLKGGFALQLRYGLLTRPTRDVDLRTLLPPDEALARLRRTVASSTVADNVSFVLGAVAQEMQGAPAGSLRVRVVSRLAGVDFVVFHIDLSSGDALVDPADLLRGSDLLAFAGIPAVEFPVYPVAQHLAEKLHAYTLPRADENTRVKDLLDMVFVASVEDVDADRLLRGIRATFDARATHPPPDQLPAPPDSWRGPFAALADETPNAPTNDLAEAYTLAREFWSAVLSGRAAGTRWSSEARTWAAFCLVRGSAE